MYVIRNRLRSNLSNGTLAFDGGIRLCPSPPDTQLRTLPDHKDGDVIEKSLASVITSGEFNGQQFAYPDTLVGMDSHTTMINGLSVMGWGVGGIEAEAVMLGQPYYMLMPEVIGFKLNGELPEGATATDLVLTLTQMLRAKGVVGKFVEYFGPGLSNLSLPDRATLANMAPEYGATMGFFPVDQITLEFLKLSAPSAAPPLLFRKM